MPPEIKTQKQCHANGTYWVVSLGAKITGEKRKRRYFPSRKEALSFIDKSLVDREKLGHEAFTLPINLRIEALACIKLLKPINSSLTQAVEFFIRNRPRPESSKTISVLAKEFIKSRKAMNCRERTLTQYESYLRVIGAEFGEVDLKTIARQDIEDWLEDSEWSARTRKNYLVTFSTLLGFALAKGYRSDNPAAAIERPLLDEKPVGILTSEQARRLLEVATAYERDLVPALAIALFAGLRRSEYFVLDWSEIDFKQRTIEIKALKAKTRQRRLVAISDNLAAWLETYQKINGSVCADSSMDAFSERLRGLVEKAGIVPWPHNAMRHSFGSYFLAKTKNENLTATEMGNSPGIVIRHYRAVVKHEQVDKYWAIVPGP